LIVGIDLGTTNSLVAAFLDGKPQLLPNALGSFLTPSAISVDEDGAILIGLAARERLSSHPDRTAAAFKRAMGTGKLFRLGRLTFKAEDLSALVLKSLKADAERFLGETVTEAVITVPAYFNDTQRKATKAAGEIAGLKVERLVNEPTAAALAYGLHELGSEQKVLVLDLGGGTFDVSVLELFEGVMEVRASAGDNFLGGEDFVDVIADLFLAEAGAKAGIKKASELEAGHAGLRRAAEVAKRALTEREETTLELIHKGRPVTWTLSRERFESASEPLLRRMRAPIERAIRDSRLTPAEIDHLVMAGGATRMPCIRRLAARLFQRLPIAQINPDEVVALGAAVQAGLKMRDAALDEVVMTDVAPFTMGISVSETHNGQVVATGLYMPIIERNTTIPVSRSKSVTTLTDNQRTILVAVYQGEARLVADNIPLGEMRVPVPAGPKGSQSLDVRFTYDPSGLLEVEARVISTGSLQRLVLEGQPGASAAEIAERLEKLAHLKIHPADQAENRAVMARAERLFEERLGDERLVVANWIDRFRQVLAGQDLREVEEFRTRMVEWLDEMDVSFFS
jgi:molecular chaperone HscC